MNLLAHAKSQYLERHLRVLIIQELACSAENLKEHLQSAGYEVRTDTISTRKDFVSRLLSFIPHIIIVDRPAPEFTGREALLFAQRLYPQVPFVFFEEDLECKDLEFLERQGASICVSREDVEMIPYVFEAALTLHQGSREQLTHMRILKEIRENLEGLDQIRSFLSDQAPADSKREEVALEMDQFNELLLRMRNLIRGRNHRDS
ncbi:response regulator [Pontibacter sp. G13]|uniref:response regulator n=1 Tax=Pontibacter sp. G13 TaxID=3074898 RepID=UPI00288958D5|nr:response regulator [Pontibacter sp. G13]WNJ19514.1 response regulator [Pontibacter sp. G13]